MTVPVDCNDLRSKLADAQAALHKLNIGGKAASVTFGPGKATTYTQANLNDLRRYVIELEEQLASCCGDYDVAPRAPVRFEF